MHGTEKSRERDYKDESKGSGECHSGGSSGTGSGNHGRRGGEDAESQNEKGQKKGRRARKPVPFSALSSFKAAIFDLDGVVMDSQPLHLRTFNKALEPLGVKIEGRAWKEKYPGVGSYAVFEDVFSRNGIRAGVKEYVERRAEIYYEELKKARVPEISGFGAFRRELEKSGIGVAVASGGHAPHVKESLRSAGLGKVPFVAIEQVKQGKPAPEIFLKTAKRLRVKPSECVVFEDALSGMQAAAAAGMPCVALATTLPGGKLRGKAALVVRNFRDRKLKRLLALLLAKRGNGGAGRSGEGGARKRAAPKRKSAGRRRK
jgi:HAD superfamily hydrolase (TIGR01509 family)